MNNPWNLPDGTKLVRKGGGEYKYCYSSCYKKWMLYSPWNDSYYDLDQPYTTEREIFSVVDRWPRYDKTW